MDYSKIEYVVEGFSSFPLSKALCLWKTKYPEFIDFEKDVITHESLQDFGKFVQECWDDIKPITVKDALKVKNTEERRVYFNCIGVEKLFKSLNPKMLDRQVINKKRTKWDDNNDAVEYEFEDVYELYEIEKEKLFGKETDSWRDDDVYAVRCWCTTTNREYWLYVPKEAALGARWATPGEPEYQPDAIRAIAWTIRMDVQNPERIYRQGDIIVVKEGANTRSIGWLTHLTKESYLELMYSET